MYLTISIICLACALAYLLVRLRYELQMMQQNSYRNNRYAKWLKSDILSATRGLGLLLFVAAAIFAGSIYVEAIVSLACILAVILELTKKYKKRLVFTKRAIRLYAASCLLSLLPAIAAFIIGGIDYAAPALLLAAVLSFAFLMLGNIVNAPIEKSINRRYYNDAKRILERNDGLIIIGITGSYGKTSTKHYLYRILSEKYNVLMTPGSYNTTMGVVRTVREMLKPYHEVFIVEMGAKQPGDIKEICDLVRPSIGILTSVGEQHLESFRTIENVQKTKFELIDSLPADGLAVLNADFPYVASRGVENVRDVARYSFADSRADYYIADINYSGSGTEFGVRHGGDAPETLRTRIVGKHNLTNILAGYIVAKKLGVDADAIRYAVSHIEQVEHRLNVRSTPGGVTVIDDAFNSNPAGAEMALEVLAAFGGGRRIVVTPGMIELGDKEFDYNRNLGKQIASAADYAIIVGQYNREAITKGLSEAGFDRAKTYEADSFRDAVAHLNGMLSKGDTVLYENDLPDTFK